MSGPTVVADLPKRCDWRDEADRRCLNTAGHAKANGSGHAVQIDGDEPARGYYPMGQEPRLRSQVAALLDQRVDLCERIAQRLEREIIGGVMPDLRKKNKQWDHAMRYAASIIRDYGAGICDACECAPGEPCCDQHTARMCDRCYRHNHRSAL